MVDDVRNVICCTNGKRVSDISRIINFFNRAPLTRDQFVFKIWLDEADKFISHIDKTFRPTLASNENVELRCLTATPKPLIDKYHRMTKVGMEETTKPDYHGWGDNDLKIVESDEHVVGFIHEVLSDPTTEIKPGSKWYIPANRKKTSHGQVRDTLLFKEFAVFVVNGDGLALTLPSSGKKKEYIEDLWLFFQTTTIPLHRGQKPITNVF